MSDHDAEAALARARSALVDRVVELAARSADGPPGGAACPACTGTTPRFTQTLAGVRHTSRICAEVSRRVNVNADNVAAMAGALVKARQALEGRMSWCERCGCTMTDAGGPLCDEDAAFWGDHVGVLGDLGRIKP